MKHLCRIGFVIALLLSATILCNADITSINLSDSPHYQVGWQYSRASSGFTLKIPFGNLYFLQPIFAFSMTQNPSPADTTSANGHFALGLRGIRELPPRNDFQPYAGVSWGHSENFAGSTLTSTTVTKGNAGFETFLGVEYQKYIFRPSLEIGLGSYSKADGSYYAGTTFNFAFMYEF